MKLIKKVYTFKYTVQYTFESVYCTVLCFNILCCLSAFVLMTMLINNNLLPPMFDRDS